MKSYVEYPFFGLHTVAWIVFTLCCGNGTISSCGQPVTCERKLRGFAELSVVGAVFYSQIRTCRLLLRMIEILWRYSGIVNFIDDITNLLVQLYHELHRNKFMVSERCTGGGSKSCMLSFSGIADTSKNDDDSPAPPTHPHLAKLPTMDRDKVEHLKTK
ncbi:hypothetical protein CBL_10507 [Carabus blaptoides fortunei]